MSYFTLPVFVLFPPFLIVFLRLISSACVLLPAVQLFMLELRSAGFSTAFHLRTAIPLCVEL